MNEKGRTVSRVLSWTIIYLDAPLPVRSCDLPAGIGRTAHLLLGLAPDEVCHAVAVTVDAVGSYPTISPLPIAGRYIFCGTLYSLTAPGCYPASCSVEPGLSSGKRMRSPAIVRSALLGLKGNLRTRPYRRNLTTNPLVSPPRSQRCAIGTALLHYRFVHNTGCGCNRGRT